MNDSFIGGDAVASPRPHREVIGTLLTLAAPLVAANISRTVMSFADFAMVSRLGREAQAAVVPAGLVLWTLTAFGMGTTSLVSTYVSQSLGRGHRKICAAYAWQGFYFSMFLGLAVLPLSVFIGPMFRSSGHGAAVTEMEITYTMIGLYSVGPTIACSAMVCFFAGVHRPGVGFLAPLVANIFNVGANYALIFGKFGFPAMGIAGAAWATLAASLLQLAILLAWFFRRRYRREFATHSMARPRWRLGRDILRLGLPVGMQSFFDIGAWTIFAIVLVGRFGEVSLAANNICFKILEVSFMPATGLSQALTAAFGRAVGQGDRGTARRYARWSMLITAFYMGSIGVAMAVFRFELPALLSKDVNVIHVAAPLMILGALFQIFDALQINFYGALRGAGDTVWPAVAVVLSLLIILLGGGWAMATWKPDWGVTGVWMAATVYIAVIGCVLGGRYRYGTWERITVFRS